MYRLGEAARVSLDITNNSRASHVALDACNRRKMSSFYISVTVGNLVMYDSVPDYFTPKCGENTTNHLGHFSDMQYHR